MFVGQAQQTCSKLQAQLHWWGLWLAPPRQVPLPYPPLALLAGLVRSKLK